MKKLNKIALLSTLAATIFASQSVLAAITPVGLWKTIDEDTNQAKSYVRITQTNGVLSGKVETILNPAKQNDICSKCDDELDFIVIDGNNENIAAYFWLFDMGKWRSRYMNVENPEEIRYLKSMIDNNELSLVEPEYSNLKIGDVVFKVR